MAGQEKGWKYATVRQVKNLERDVMAKISEVKKDQQDKGFKGVIGALKDIAKAIREGGSGGGLSEADAIEVRDNLQAHVNKLGSTGKEGKT